MSMVELPTTVVYEYMSMIKLTTIVVYECMSMVYIYCKKQHQW